MNDICLSHLHQARSLSASHQVSSDTRSVAVPGVQLASLGWLLQRED